MDIMDSEAVFAGRGYMRSLLAIMGAAKLSKFISCRRRIIYWRATYVTSKERYTSASQRKINGYHKTLIFLRKLIYRMC
jgi:hypothetical protein